MNRSLWFLGTLALIGAVAFGQETQPSDESPAPAAKAPVAPAAKAPIPDAAALKKAGDLANDVYGKEISKAVNLEQKAALGKKLLQSGIDEPGDHAARYVLLGMAMDMAVQAADVDTAFAAVGEQVKGFEVDGLKLKADTLAKLERVRGADGTVLAEQCTRLIDEAIVADRYEVAKQVAERGIVLAKKTGDRGAFQAATARQQEVQAIETGHGQAQKALAILTTDSNNTAAYLTVGRFYCFAKGDWEKGVPMLANSSDKALKAVADMEVAKPTEPAKQVELADAWWDLAAKEKGRSQRRLREHAGEWYRKAQPRLTGVPKLKAGIRLEEIQRIAENSPVWTVIFRSDDPSIWNTNVNQGRSRFAIALSRVPNNVRFLRMACAGKSVIIPITKETLDKNNSGEGTVFWNGGARHAYNAVTLGVAYKDCVVGRGSILVCILPPVDWGGFGFGVRGWINDKQGYAWEGKEIDRTVFEIAVAPSITPEEGKQLLTDKDTRKGK